MRNLRLRTIRSQSFYLYTKITVSKLKNEVFQKNLKGLNSYFFRFCYNSKEVYAMKKIVFAWEISVAVRWQSL